MTDRLTVDTITDDQLDALYDQLAKAERGLAVIPRLIARARELDPHGHSDYLLGFRDALARVTRTIARVNQEAQR